MRSKTLFALGLSLVTITSFVTAGMAKECMKLNAIGAVGYTNLRSGPSLDAPKVDTVNSVGYGSDANALTWCGTWKFDQAGHRHDADGTPIRWLFVSYKIYGDSNTRYGWISDSVAGLPRF